MECVRNESDVFFDAMSSEQMKIHDAEVKQLNVDRTIIFNEIQSCKSAVKDVMDQIKTHPSTSKQVAANIDCSQADVHACVASLVNQVVNAQESDDAFTSSQVTKLCKLSDHVRTLENLYSKFDSRLTTATAAQNRFNKHLATVSCNLNTVIVNQQIDRQYSRINNLIVERLKGVPPNLKGDAFDQRLADQLNSLLSLKLTPNDFDTAHP